MNMGSQDSGKIVACLAASGTKLDRPDLSFRLISTPYLIQTIHCSMSSLCAPRPPTLTPLTYGFGWPLGSRHRTSGLPGSVT